MTQLERCPRRAHRVLLGFAMILAAILYMDRVCIAQSQYLISEELGLSKQQMGLAFTVFGIAYGLFEIPGGWLADRFGPRRVLTSGVVWWSLFTVASGWARGLASLVSYRFLFGLGQACMDMGGRFSGTLSGTMNTWGCIGGLLAPWTIPYILDAAGGQWRVVILVIAGWYAVGALCWLGIDPVTPVAAPEGGGGDQDEFTIPEIAVDQT